MDYKYSCKDNDISLKSLQTHTKHDVMILFSYVNPHKRPSNTHIQYELHSELLGPIHIHSFSLAPIPTSPTYKSGSPSFKAMNSPSWGAQGQGLGDKRPHGLGTRLGPPCL